MSGLSFMVLVLSTAAVGVGTTTASGAAPSPVPSAPTIDQSSGTLFVGRSMFQKVTAEGFPKASFTESGALPSGVSFVSSNGAAKFIGTPAPGTGADYNVMLTATNSQGSDTEPYDLTVQQNPSFPPGFCPSPVTVGQYTHDDQTVAAWPPFFGLDENNALPDGVQFEQNLINEDLGSLSGTPQPGSGGIYGLQYTADANNAIHNLHCKLVVDEAPAFTDPGTATIVAGTKLGAAVSIGGTTGFPRTVTVSNTGTIPTGLTTHTRHGAKTFSLSLSGTPQSSTAGDYLIHVAADNGAQASEDFVLVDQAAGSTPSPTTLTLSPEVDPVTFGSSAQTFTATVSGGAAPSGYVQFSLGSGITTVPLSDGSATFTTPGNLDVADYTVSATYTGDALNASSTAAEDLNVEAASTTLTLSGPTSTPFGIPITYTATVSCTPSCGTTPTGSVDFNQEGIDNPIDLVNGVATFVTDPTVAPSLDNEVDATFTSFTDSAQDFSPSDTESAFYDVGGVNLSSEVGDGVQADGTTPVPDGATVTVDPTQATEFSAQLLAEASGGGLPPGPLVIDVVQSSTDVTAQLGLSDGSDPAPSADPGTGTADYFWTLSPGDLGQLTGTSATVSISSAGSDNFVPAALTFTLDWGS